MKDLSNENVVHINKNGVQYLQFRRLLEYRDIIEHAYPLGQNLNFRADKINREDLSKEQEEKELESYKKICETLEINYKNIVRGNQEHTDHIEVVNEKINKNNVDINIKKYNNTDGLITNKKDLILSTTNADCILMIFFDPITKTIANIHSGWKGTVQRISTKTVRKMENEFNCKPEDIICCICPSIRKCHFEVDIDVKEIFEKEFKDLGNTNLEQIIEKQQEKEKWNIDTVLINKIILERVGLKKENIIDSGICSICNSDLIHSYRVEKEGYGKSTVLITLNGKDK